MRIFHLLSLFVLFIAAAWSVAGEVVEGSRSAVELGVFPLTMTTASDNDFQKKMSEYETALKIAESNTSDQKTIAKCLYKLGVLY